MALARHLVLYQSSVFARAAARPALVCDPDTRPLRVRDMQRLSVFEHRCPRSIGKITCENLSVTEMLCLRYWAQDPIYVRDTESK